jgi:hypothetical protein
MQLNVHHQVQLAIGFRLDCKALDANRLQRYILNLIHSLHAKADAAKTSALM